MDKKGIMIIIAVLVILGGSLILMKYKNTAVTPPAAVEVDPDQEMEAAKIPKPADMEKKVVQPDTTATGENDGMVTSVEVKVLKADAAKKTMTVDERGTSVDLILNDGTMVASFQGGKMNELKFTDIKPDTTANVTYYNSNKFVISVIYPEK